MCIIHVRQKGQTSAHAFKIKKVDPLSKLAGAYCKKNQFSTITLERDGRKLDLNKSPLAEGVPSVAYLDAVAVGGDGGGGGPGVKVKFRVNGSSSDVVSLSVPFKGDFRSVMARFAERRKVAVDRCKFVFDGEALPPTSTPEELDLEGEEIVDVVVMEEGGGGGAKKLNGGVVSGQGEGKAISRAGAAASAAPPTSISIKTNRNRNNNPRQKTWKFHDTDPLSKLKADYIKLYKSKGCRTVKFYFSNEVLGDMAKTFQDLGIGEGDVVYAMENNKAYRPVRS